jgi:hypothetical protein
MINTFASLRTWLGKLAMPMPSAETFAVAIGGLAREYDVFANEGSMGTNNFPSLFVLGLWQLTDRGVHSYQPFSTRFHSCFQFGFRSLSRQREGVESTGKDGP